MQKVFHVVQIHHSFDYFVSDLNLLDLGELLLLFMELVEQTAILQELSDQDKLFSSNADTHIENYIGMFQVAYYHDFLHEILSMPMFCRFEVIFDRYFLTYVFTFVDFAVTSLTD